MSAYHYVLDDEFVWDLAKGIRGSRDRGVILISLSVTSTEGTESSSDRNFEKERLNAQGSL